MNVPRVFSVDGLWYVTDSGGSPRFRSTDESRARGYLERNWRFLMFNPDGAGSYVDPARLGETVTGR